MHNEEGTKGTPSAQERTRWDPVGGGGNGEIMFSPGFQAVAAMAGWDEESIIASLTVEDTPDREKMGNSRHKKRSDLNFKTPPSTNSRRKRRANRKSPTAIPVQVLNLDEEEPAKEDTEKKTTVVGPEISAIDRGGDEEPAKEDGEKKTVVGPQTSASDKGDDEEPAKEDNGKKTVVGPDISAIDEGGEKREGHQLEEEKCSSSVLPFIDKLREELSCAICLEICFEPSTTSCGHSFCKKCLRNAADKCGKKCPKCRQLISNGRSCTINTVLWNTIQLLFPKEVEARKASKEVLKSEESEDGGSLGRRRSIDHVRDAGARHLGVSRWSAPSVSDGQRSIPHRDEDPQLARRLRRDDLSQLASRDSSETRRSSRRRGGTPALQDEDAALALRLQREEFMEAFRGTNEQAAGSSISVARANLRALASRAISNRMRDRDL